MDLLISPRAVIKLIHCLPCRHRLIYWGQNKMDNPWRGDAMEMLSVLLALCEGTPSHTPFWCWGWAIPGELSQFYGCWCSGSYHCQLISFHVIDNVEWMGFCLLWERISTTFTILVLNNSRKCKYILMFPKINSAVKGQNVSCLMSSNALI